MIRRQRAAAHHRRDLAELAHARTILLDRRRFLLATAGGSLALLFGLRSPARAATDFDPWPTLDAVTRHLLPSEDDSPGAAEINALDYLRFVVADEFVDADERTFILQGNSWLEQLAGEQHGAPFTALDQAQRERLLRQVASSAAGENWLATLITYLFEALLTAPAYGGNPQGIGWKWLAYVPGFPLPGAGTRYPELPL